MEKSKKRDLENLGKKWRNCGQEKRMEVGKGIFEKKEEEFGVEGSRSRMEKEKRRWRFWVNLGWRLKDLWRNWRKRKKFGEFERNLGWEWMEDASRYGCGGFRERRGRQRGSWMKTEVEEEAIGQNPWPWPGSRPQADRGACCLDTFEKKFRLFFSIYTTGHDVRYALPVMALQALTFSSFWPQPVLKGMVWLWS